MSENALPTAGWIDDPAEPETLRYWDGTAWTLSSAPKSSAITNPHTGVTAPAAGLYDDPTDESTQRYWDGTAWTTTTAAKVSKKSASPRNKWLIAIAIVVGLLLVGAAGLAIGQNLGNDSDSAESTQSAAPAPEPEATEEVAEPEAPVQTAEPIDPGVDVAEFTEKANSQLDDINSALDDMTTAVNDAKTLGILLSYVQLQFNYGQLLLLTEPESVEATWDPALEGLETSLESLGSQLSAEDAALTLEAIEAVRTASETVRGVANSAT